jgi:hypothetical protein
LTRPSPFLAGAAVLVLGLGAYAAAAYLLAPRGSDQDGRVAAEAVSVVAHAQRLADGEAFVGDIEILRDASDLRLRNYELPAAEKLTALRQMLLLNTNRFEALALLDLQGNVVQETASMFEGVGQGGVYFEAVRTGGVTASFDDGIATYAAPVRGFDDAVIGVLVGRMTHERVWSQTLGLSIDGGRTLVVAPDGSALDREYEERFALALPESGVALMELPGGNAYCAAAPVGMGTHLDAGMRVAYCLPASLAVAETLPFRQYLIDLMGIATIIAAIGTVALAYLIREREPSPVDEQEQPAPLSAVEARLLAHKEGAGR